MENNLDEMNNSELLLNALIPFAQQQLEKNGEFAPFGATISEENKEVRLAMATSDKNADSKKMIEMLTEGFRANIDSHKTVAVGLCFNTGVKIGDDMKDAIFISFEGKSERPMNIFLPYEKEREGKYLYGELVASGRDATIFN